MSHSTYWVYLGSPFLLSHCLWFPWRDMERFHLWFRMRLLNLLLINRKGVEGSVVLFVFLMFSVLWCCSAWGKPARFRAGQFLESSEGWTWGVPLTCGLLVHSHAASTGPSTPGGNIPLPEPSRARNQAPRDCSHSLAPVKLFKLASPKQLTWPCLEFGAETLTKVRVWTLLSSHFCLLDNAGVFPRGLCGVLGILFLAPLNIRKLVYWSPFCVSSRGCTRMAITWKNTEHPWTTFSAFSTQVIIFGLKDEVTIGTIFFSIFLHFLPHPGRNKWEGKAFACAQERHPWELCIESCSLEDACTPLFPPVCFSKAGMLLAVLLSLQPSTDFLASACWVGEAKGWNASLAPRKCESQWGNGYI